MVEIKVRIDALPDPSKEDEARDYLTIAQKRLEAYREARRQHERPTQESELANKLLEAYNTSAKVVLAT